MTPNLCLATCFQKVNQGEFTIHYLISANVERIYSPQTSYKSSPIRCLLSHIAQLLSAATNASNTVLKR